MSCYHPLKGFQLGIKDNGKKDLVVCSYEVDHLELRNGSIIRCADSFVSPYAERVYRQFQEIPCGQCLGCRLAYSRDWANRCMLELEYHDSAYFVTLTYDDVHVPRSWYADPDTGEAFRALTLSVRDCQLFMKRLRKRYSTDSIRFFLAGEYGPQTLRPHYHAILFGLHLDDLYEWQRSPGGFVYYRSPGLEKVWPFGHICVANVSWDTCAYTARYIVKKLKGKEGQFYVDHNMKPPFTLMSRRPGIAAQWFYDHPDVYEHEFINISTPEGGKKFRPPGYFDRLYDIEHPDELKEIKEARQKLAEDAKKLKLERTNLSYLELLAVEERNKQAKIEALKRGDCLEV